VRGSPALREKEDLLAAVPGIGTMIARMLLVGLPELGTLNRRRIAALVGRALDPPVRTVEGQELHPRIKSEDRWQGRGPRRPVHGRQGGRQAQSRPESPATGSSPPESPSSSAARSVPNPAAMPWPAY